MSGKTKGRAHRINVLKDIQVKTLPPGFHADGGSLYLLVKSLGTGPDGKEIAGARRYVVRVVVRRTGHDGQPLKGARHDVTLGNNTELTLKEARDKAREIVDAAKRGEDVLAINRQQRRPAPEAAPVKIITFAEIAEKCHAAKTHGWTNGKHVQQWINTVRTYAFPRMKDSDIATIEATDIYEVLRPIWHEKRETADRLRQRLADVFDHARILRVRDAENPVKLDDIVHALGERSKAAKRKKHHDALPYNRIHEFIAELRVFPKVQEPTRLALEWLILNASRDGEAAGAVWGEVDSRARTWTLPPDRHKAGKTATDARPHVVPLTPRAMAILEAAKQFSDSTNPKAFIFPGNAQSAKRRGMMSENTFNSLSQSISDKINGGPVTAHGFRSCFRTWAGEKTAHPREVCEAALAHTLESDVEAAYMRGEALEKRRLLMADWARFVEQPWVDIEDGSNVVTLQTARIPD